MKRYVLIPFAIIAIMLGLTACGGGDTGNVTIEITPRGEQMLFEQTEFTVRPGQTVRLVFRNTASSAAMHHNVVVLSDNDAASRVGQAAIEVGEAGDWVPNDPAVYAYTPMAAPGETVEVTFTAPETEGDYLYICTYPGHYMMMQGIMKVRG